MAEKSDHDLIIEMHQALTAPDTGVCAQVKALNNAVYGNGKMGLEKKMLIVIVALCILAMDSPLVAKMMALIVK